jgi:NAD(P)-dependent dehydrogenase (short-subunit alcohol dehydrogenase family)
MKNYLVTGGTDGIGKALIELLLKDKNNYIINT